MSGRVVAFLVALVLLLSGWTTQVEAMTFAPAVAEQAAPGPANDGPADDRQTPGQGSAAEGAIDLPALVMTGPQAGSPALTMSRPRPYALAAIHSADLDGPQRPPRATPVAA